MKRIFFLSLFFFHLNYSNSIENLWTQTYEKAINGYWGKTESVSGPGSSLEQTIMIRRELPNILSMLKITTILDLPCGDFNWMSFVDLSNYIYIGADIVAPLIEQNNSLHSTSKRIFLHLDVTMDILPKCDLIISRDLLVHLSREDAFKTLNNFKQSGAKYLLSTTFTAYHRTNSIIETGGWYPINLQADPFFFPKPDIIINEKCSEQNGIYSDKSLGLWRLETITIQSYE